MKETLMVRGKLLTLPTFESDDNPNIPVNDIWVYGGLVHDEIDNEYTIIYLDEEDGKPIVCLPNQDSITKTTNLKDVDGDIVFEKDILRGVDGEFYVVVDDFGVLGVTSLRMFKNDLWQYNTNWVIRNEGNDIITKSKVVGNLIDNPEFMDKFEGDLTY